MGYDPDDGCFLCHSGIYEEVEGTCEEDCNPHINVVCQDCIETHQNLRWYRASRGWKYTRPDEIVGDNEDYDEGYDEDYGMVRGICCFCEKTGFFRGQKINSCASHHVYFNIVVTVTKFP